MKDFWLSTNKENAGDRILTGYVGKFKDMPSSEWLLDFAGTRNHVLDFGCGIGRNSVGLSKNFKKVVGYDLPNMINLIPKNNRLKNIKYTSDWEQVKNKKIDVILASLVFQHIHDNELVEYLKDMVKMTNTIVLSSRTWIDDTNSQVLDIVNNFFNVNIINPIENDHFTAILKNK